MRRSKVRSLRRRGRACITPPECRRDGSAQGRDRSPKVARYASAGNASRLAPTPQAIHACATLRDHSGPTSRVVLRDVWPGAFRCGLDFSFRLQCSTVLGVSMGQARPFLAALITLMLFTGCSPDVALNTYPEFGKSLVADLQARNFEAVEAKLDLALKRTTTRAKLLEMAQVLPATAPTSVRVAQLHVMSTWQLAGSEPRRVWLALQYQFTDKWVLATFVWRENERGFQAIDGFQITPLPASLETINRFTLVDKGLTHHVVLGLAVALPLFTVFVLVLCLTTSIRGGARRFGHWRFCLG